MSDNSCGAYWNREAGCHDLYLLLVCDMRHKLQFAIISRDVYYLSCFTNIHRITIRLTLIRICTNKWEN